jgi:hypothetical protein
MPNDSNTFLIACFNTAREEVLFRVRHRDGWLRVNLLSQAALLALASGVKYVVEGHKPEFACLAPFVSLVFACMYTVEDRLIGQLGNYIGSLSEAEAVLSERKGRMIVNWDLSPQLQEGYTNGPALKVRLLAQLLSFVLIPGVIGWIGISFITQWPLVNWARCLIGVALIVSGGICVFGYLSRQKSATTSSALALRSLATGDSSGFME